MSIKDHPSCVELFQMIEQYIEIEQQIGILQDRMRELKANVNGKLKPAFDDITRNQAKDLAYELYWNSGSCVDSSELGRAYTGSAYRVHVHVDSQIVETNCSYCETEMDIIIHSRSERDEFLRGKSRFECDKCRDQRLKKMQEDADRAQARLQAWSNRVYELQQMKYSEYLKTDHWQELRNRMLKRSGYKCQLCNASSTLHVHHRTYERKGYEELSDLIVLCAKCHAKFHDKYASTEEGDNE